MDKLEDSDAMVRMEYRKSAKEDLTLRLKTVVTIN